MRRNYLYASDSEVPPGITMQRYVAAAVLILLGAPFAYANGQLGLRSSRETFAVAVSHPPEVFLPNVKRIAIGFGGSTSCAQLLKDRMSETVTRGGSLELLTVPLNQDLRPWATTERANAVKLGTQLSPTALVTGNVSRCTADDSPLKRQQSKDKKGRITTYYSRETTGHVAASVQVIELATSKVLLYRTFVSDTVEAQSATDQMPDAVDHTQLIGRAASAVEQNIEHLLFPWTESVTVTVHADKECDLKPAATQIRAGDFTGAAETMQKAIDRQCGAPDDKIALAKAYHNRGVALTYAGKPDDGLKSLQEANRLWPGNVSEEAMTASRKIIAARGQQQSQDAAAADLQKTEMANAAAATEAANASRLSNKDVVDMVQAKLSDQIILGKIRTTKCRFDTAPAALIQLKKSGASDAVVLAVTSAQCS